MFDRWVSFTHGSPSKSNIGFKAMLESGEPMSLERSNEKCKVYKITIQNCF